MAAVTAVLAIGGAGCESFQLGKGGGAVKVPEEGLLGAKVTAMEYAMDHLPEEDRKYLDGAYAAYGVLDTDPLQQRALVAMLKGRQPPVIDASALYSRSSNSQWYDGRPAMKWTAAASKDPEQDNRAEVVVGWMHSQIINQFTTYKLEYNGETWVVLDVELLQDAQAELGR